MTQPIQLDFPARRAQRSMPLPAAGLALAGALVSGACASHSAVLRTRCDGRVNGGALLTVDVVRASGDDVRRIQRLGASWFYEPARETLQDKVETLTFATPDMSLVSAGTSDTPAGRATGARVLPKPSACARSLPLRARKGRDFLVIIGDFRDPDPGPGRTLVVLPRKEWAGRTLDLTLGDRSLRVEAR